MLKQRDAYILIVFQEFLGHIPRSETSLCEALEKALGSPHRGEEMVRWKPNSKLCAASWLSTLWTGVHSVGEEK